jgi:hypothetical protein
MPAGTIALTNNSATVTGTGTSFTTELKPGDFVYVTVGGAPYTLVASNITSNTQFMLTVAFDGPTTTGLAWNAVPASLQVAITQKILNDFAQVARGRILDFQNWQKIYSSDQSITVTRPDRTQFTGPSWGYMSTQFGSMLTKSDNLASLTDKSASRNNLGVAYGSTAGTVAQGNDSRLNTVNNKSGGSISSAVNIAGMIQQTLVGSYYYNTAPQTESSGNVNCVGARMAGSSTPWDVTLRYYLVTGSYHCFQIVQSNSETFRVQSNGYAYATTFNNTSDSNLKFNKKFLTSALINTVTTRGMSYNLQGAKKAGIIAQDVQKFMPEAITTNTDPVVLEDGTILKETLSLDYSAISGLHTEAIKELIPLMMEMLTSPETAKEKLSNLIAAINTSTADANNTDMKMEWALLNPPTTPLVGEVAADNEHDSSEEIGS